MEEVNKKRERERNGYHFNATEVAAVGGLAAEAREVTEASRRPSRPLPLWEVDEGGYSSLGWAWEGPADKADTCGTDTPVDTKLARRNSRADLAAAAAAVAEASEEADGSAEGKRAQRPGSRRSLLGTWLRRMQRSLEQ